MERRIRSLVRWNALAMVMRANSQSEGIGGHIASFSSAATLYDVGFNYFFRGADKDNLGDLVFFQGHSSPGMYARSFLEGRLSAEQLDKFRREVDGQGLSSYPHPWLMPDYWQFPTVSMGLGPIQAIYHAHVMRYLSARGLVPRGDRKVWAFLGVMAISSSIQFSHLAYYLSLFSLSPSHLSLLKQHAIEIVIVLRPGAAGLGWRRRR